MMGIIEEIYFIIGDFKKKQPKFKKPDYIYIGNEERNNLFMTAEFRLQNHHLSAKKPFTMFGVEIVEVNKESFLEVGEKNENR
ncbi:hypothetical protein CPT_Pascal28 [Bacillus phage Pascal]|uniref:Uncharacterized protein n=1 Tax=Bacillus phage Pascal TaxID=1540092 RepID=A0A0A0RVF1_9CAUD|nr:hypothetical protein CPT_Pascal28 [Bacillus phage Pascal]AIW03663.1 hypothetical protein CPT_Pascal28 [Bacillus phage Pascal]